MRWNAKNGRAAVGDTGMSYVSFGQGEKTLVVLPGLSDGLTTVNGKARMLSKPYRPFLDQYTVYMFSRKDSMPEGHSIRDMAEDQAEALRTLGLEKVSVLGVSEGGMIAQALAAAHPDLVEKLVIAVSAPCVNDQMRSCVENWITLAEQGNHKQLMIDTAEKSYSPDRLKKYRMLYPVIGLIGKPADYGRFLVNARAVLSFDAGEDLKKITCPTLIIGGSKDQIVGLDASYDMKNSIKGSELFVYMGLGHAAYEEAEDFYQRVFEFLGREGGHGLSDTEVQRNPAKLTVESDEAEYSRSSGGIFGE